MKKEILVLLVCLLPLTSSFAQLSFEGTIGVGPTIINIERLVAIDEITNTVAQDWGQFCHGFSGQGFYDIGNIGIGIEFMYQSLYWYSVRIPYGDYSLYRDYEISAFKISPLVRFRSDNAFNIDMGPEINFNSDGIMYGILLSINYFIKISDKIDIPVKLRSELISSIVIMVPITLNAGIRFKL